MGGVGLCGEEMCDALQYTLTNSGLILINISIPKADDMPTKTRKISRPPPIKICLLDRPMIVTVDFNRKLCFATGKIDNILIDQMLTAKFVTPLNAWRANSAKALFQLASGPGASGALWCGDTLTYVQLQKSHSSHGLRP